MSENIEWETVNLDKHQLSPAIQSLMQADSFCFPVVQIGTYKVQKAPHTHISEMTYELQKHNERQVSGLAFNFSLAHRNRTTKWLDMVSIMTVRHHYPHREYHITGLLVDPLITHSVSEAAAHIHTQLKELTERVLFISELERCFWEQRDQPGNPNKTHASPTNVHGAASRTIEKFVRFFGSPTNVTLYTPRKLVQLCTVTHGGKLDVDVLMKNCYNATNEYYDQHDRGQTMSTLLPHELFPYPKCDGQVNHTLHNRLPQQKTE